MSRSDQTRAKTPPPADDDPLYRRTCTRCGRTRNWTIGICPDCSSGEFWIRREALGFYESSGPLPGQKRLF